jgi:hypothetical protein
MGRLQHDVITIPNHLGNLRLAKSFTRLAYIYRINLLLLVVIVCRNW